MYYLHQPPVGPQAPRATALPPASKKCVCAPGQPWEQTPEGILNREVRLKPQVSPRSYATKEKELKSVLPDAGTTDLQTPLLAS